MIRGLKTSPLLTGLRGTPGCGIRMLELGSLSSESHV